MLRLHCMNRMRHKSIGCGLQTDKIEVKKPVMLPR